jgi:hypothetical protein
MIVNTDIDIDIAERDKLLRLIKHTPAMIKNDGKERKHNTGVYFHEIPENPFNGMATVDHKAAEELGYFKIDVLNVSLYKKIKSPEHMDELLSMTPVWELLEHEDVVSQLFHIHNYFNIVSSMRPRSVPELAAVLAIIRPAKRHLANKPWDVVFKTVWDKPDSGEYFFKKAHAHAYALAIVLQLNMLATGISLQD